MLIAALEIEIRRPVGAAMAVLEDSRMGGTGIDPDIERVAAGGQRCRRRPAGGQLDPLQDLSWRGVVPEIGPPGRNLVSNRAGDVRVEIGFLLRIVECRDRHPPGALAADAPVGTRFDGAPDPSLAP